eukprot:GEZU01008831.1.p1 GENE.GEZU01008831.1~~GEZU01008831.1.p1  ORF type:complete len:442 (-),score=201.30 GEZU01008831.1:138-1463(-)
MAEYIQKKREMFLLQMSLDTKKQEIQKLDEMAEAREEKLRRDEQMLLKDEQKFNEFLKDNDLRAVDAMKKAETQTKAKQDKVAEIKKLTHRITAIKNEMSKYEEQLEDCRKYKKFLDDLTPPEWLEEQERKRVQRREQRKKEREERLKAEAAAAMSNNNNASASDNNNNDSSLSDGNATSGGTTVLEIIAPVDSDDEDLLDEEEMEMYFKTPEQLLVKFTELEENNLFLIQMCQETEEQLEEVKSKLNSARQKMDKQSENLQKQIEAIQAQIAQEEEKARMIQERARTKTGGEQQEQLLKQINAKVAEIYLNSGFDNDTSIGTLTMLTNIESKLENLLSVIQTLPAEFVANTEKQKERQRRQEVREEKKEKQKRQQEIRIKRYLKRSQAPVMKKTGKPLMFRSVPVEKQKKNGTGNESDGQNRGKDGEDSLADDFVHMFFV